MNVSTTLPPAEALFPLFMTELRAAFYPRSAPVEFGEDAPTQGVYGLQHFRGEFWELGSLSETNPHREITVITTPLTETTSSYKNMVDCASRKIKDGNQKP